MRATGSDASPARGTRSPANDSQFEPALRLPALVVSVAASKPLGDRVVVEPLEQEEMTASGLVLPETAKEKPQKGTVMAAGPGARDDDGKRVPLDFASGALSHSYRLYSSVYRAAYHVVYAIHRAAQGSGIRLPLGLKARLRKVF